MRSLSAERIEVPHGRTSICDLQERAHADVDRQAAFVRSMTRPITTFRSAGLLDLVPNLIFSAFSRERTT
jgi:hypothetical protein